MLDMVRISSGKFWMGARGNEVDTEEWEYPRHLVKVSEFWMGKFTVTQAQWKAVAQFPQVNRELEADPSNFKGLDKPVEQVSWFDAVEFCDRLSKRTGNTYRLPSEAEWEYACRAGTETPFHFGETLSADLANYHANYTYGGGKKGAYRKSTIEVGSFPSNLFGLYDMHGNVVEWCMDDWHDNYQKGESTEFCVSDLSSE